MKSFSNEILNFILQRVLYLRESAKKAVLNKRLNKCPSHGKDRLKALSYVPMYT